MDHPTVKTIICSGSPFDIGFQHGTAAAEEIHRNIATYTGFFQETAKITWEQGRDRAVAQFLPTLEAKYPEILLEMEGIAKGTDDDSGREILSKEDILTLNVRSEISLTNYADGCTSLSQVEEGEAEQKKKVFVAQNWDWLEELQLGMVMLDIRPQGSDMRLKLLGEAGIVGKFGLNNAGFGFCMNALRSGAFNSRNLPVHVMARKLLQYATNVDEALAIMTEFGTASTTNFMLADRSGKHLDIECSPKGDTLIWPQKGYVAHTNHLYGSSRPVGLVDHPAENSFSRLARMQKLTEMGIEAEEPLTYASIRRRLSDEEGKPYSICRDRPPGAQGMERMTTLACIMMELKSGTAKVLIGRPCDNLPVVEWSI